MIELLTGIWKDAAETITKRGWVKGVVESSTGEVCLTGALKVCAPQPGDWLIARAVARRRGHAESWNDSSDRKEVEVIKWLRGAEEITDVELEKVFGPQWESIVWLIRRAASLTESEIEAFYKNYVAGYAARASYAADAVVAAVAAVTVSYAADAAADAAAAAGYVAAVAAAADAAAVAAAAAGYAAANAAAVTVSYAADTAARAISTWHLATLDGEYTFYHRDTLISRWESIIGLPPLLKREEA